MGRLEKIWNIIACTWVFGGGIAVSLLCLAIFNWRVALVMFAV